MWPYLHNCLQTHPTPQWVHIYTRGCIQSRLMLSRVGAGLQSSSRAVAFLKGHQKHLTPSLDFIPSEGHYCGISWLMKRTDIY